MSVNPRVKRQIRSGRSGTGEAKLNITSMMDMFTIILVFLLKSFSTQGQLVTPASGLLIPTSSVERPAKSALDIQISDSKISVENKVVLDEKEFAQIKEQKEFLIDPLFQVLKKYAEESRNLAELTGSEFSGEIAIQGDVNVPYKILTRIMYTCGQAGYPDMNLVVYRNN